MVGIVAIQGDYENHALAFDRCGSESRFVRISSDLEGVDRIVIPGGESTTVGKLLSRFGLGESLISCANNGMPLWGTCMGMILMAKEVEGYNQYSLGVLDVTVRRNAFGAQVHSFEDEVGVTGLDDPIMAVFIRAPVVVRYGSSVDVISTYREQIVAVRQGNLLGTSFHPELTEDDRLHRWFLTW